MPTERQFSEELEDWLESDGTKTLGVLATRSAKRASP